MHEFSRAARVENVRGRQRRAVADSAKIRFLSGVLLVRLWVRAVFRWFRCAAPSAIEIRSSAAHRRSTLRVDKYSGPLHFVSDYNAGLGV